MAQSPLPMGGANPAAESGNRTSLITFNGIGFPALPTFNTGTRPTLLESRQAKKVKAFMENLLLRTTGKMVTGSPPMNRFEMVFHPYKNELELWIQTDLKWDMRPKLGGHLNINSHLIYSELTDIFLAASAANGVAIQNRSGTAGLLKLAIGMPGTALGYIGHKSNGSPDNSIYVWPNDGSADEVLSTNGSGVLSWVAAGGGGFTSFSVDGDTGPAQTITNGNTLLILGGTDLASVASATDTLTINHSASGVSAATYGDATHVARITINAQGHITAASAVSISGAGGLSSWDAAADSGDTMTIDTTNNELKIIGDVGGPIATIGEDAGGIMSCYIKHADTPVSAGTYPLGVNPQKLIQISVDEWGHITAASEYAITGGGGSMSSFDVDGDSGPAQTITNGNTLLILGGNGLDSVASATDTVTVAIDDTIAQAVALTADGGTASGDATVNIDNHSSANTVGLVAGDNVTLTGSNSAGTVKIEASGGGGGGMTSFDVDGDTGPAQTITNGNTLNILGGTDLASVASATDTLTVNHSTSGVSAATYGDATHVAQIAINAQGHITAASEVTISGGGGGGGVILQVVGNSLGAATSTTDTSYATCISQAITPAATGNKVLVAGNVNIVVPYDTNQSQEGQCDAQLFRDSTALGLVKTIYSDDFGNMGTGSYATLAWNYLDSPSSTSAVTYYLKYKSYDPSGFGAPQIELLDAQITIQEVD